MTLYKTICLPAAIAVALCASAQDDGVTKKVSVSGSIQSDILIPQEDKEINARGYDEWALTNTYADVNVTSEHFDAGARFEFTEYPLPSFYDEQGFKGWGVPYIYVKARFKSWDLTLGNFYEQFGSGFILRTYEERTLGIDNSLLGGRLVLRPVKGVTAKVLSGKQRRFWSHNDGWVTGADVELNIDQWSKAMTESGTYLTLVHPAGKAAVRNANSPQSKSLNFPIPICRINVSCLRPS